MAEVPARAWVFRRWPVAGRTGRPARSAACPRRWIASPTRGDAGRANQDPVAQGRTDPGAGPATSRPSGKGRSVGAHRWVPLARPKRCFCRRAGREAQAACRRRRPMPASTARPPLAGNTVKGHRMGHGTPLRRPGDLSSAVQGRRPAGGRLRRAIPLAALAALSTACSINSDPAGHPPRGLAPPPAALTAPPPPAAAPTPRMVAAGDASDAARRSPPSRPPLR